MSDPIILVSAANGPVIAADETGIVLHLSDRVVRDIARRLPGVAGALDEPDSTLIADDPPATDSAPVARGAAWVPDDIDWWNAQADGDWTRFDARLPGAAETRRYARHSAGPGIVADAPGAFQAVISLAGPRRYTLQSARPDFPFHVISCPPPEPEENPLFANLAHRGADSAVCDALLWRKYNAFRRLPVFIAQPCLLPAGGLPDHAQLAEFSQALERIAALAAAMGKPSRVAAIALEIGPQHLGAGQDAAALHCAVLRLLDWVAAQMRSLDMGEAPVLLTADAGAWWNSDVAAARQAAEAIQRLVLCPGNHQIIPIGSTAGQAQDDLGMPTGDTIAAQAAREAWVVEAVRSGEACGAPVLYLAEFIDARRVRAIFKSRAGLAIDADGDSGAGLSLTLTDTDEDWPVASVAPDPEDAGSLIVTLQADAPPGRELRLNHALPHQSGAKAGYRATAICDAAEGAPQSGAAAPPRFWAMPGSMVVR